jgi:cyclophilin family peptidyl-prolyl cis-trans isomerase
MSVLLVTSFGDIVIDLYPNKAPNACLNFLKLCKLKHYNNALLTEVQKSKKKSMQTMSLKLSQTLPPLSGKRLEKTCPISETR